MYYLAQTNDFSTKSESRDNFTQLGAPDEEDVQDKATETDRDIRDIIRVFQAIKAAPTEEIRQKIREQHPSIAATLDYREQRRALVEANRERIRAEREGERVREHEESEVNRAPPEPTSAPSEGGYATSKPKIQVVAGRLPEIVDQVEDHLLASGGIYQRNARLVRIGDLVLPNRKPALAPIEISVENLIDVLTQRFHWSKYDGRRKESILCNCPREVAATLLARTGQWKLPPLHAVITAPTLREDGSILDRPGFDLGTGIYYDPQDVGFPSINETPTWHQARRALDELIDLVSEVPFVKHDEHGEVGRAVFLSAFLTGLIRCSLPSAPLHAFDAPVAGSGKTMLANVVSLAETGEPACVLSQGQTEEEMEKRLATVLRSGDAVIVFDNCTRPIEGDLLCQAITSPILNLRILGKSERIRVVNSAVYMATGNNLVVVGDMIRRTLRATIDPQVECPESRTFTSERPDERVARERPKYVVAGLTVLRAFHVAGRPKQAAAGEGFDAWTRWVRDAVIWLGEPDPWLATGQTRQEDPERQKVAAVLREWYGAFPEVSLRVQDLMDRALEMVETNDPRRPRKFVNEALKDALVAVADDGVGKISKQKLGKWIADHKQRIIDGYQIGSPTVRNGYTFWAIRLATP